MFNTCHYFLVGIARQLVSIGGESAQVELFACEKCRHEFEALKATLRLSMRVLENAAPQPGYWNGYNSRLRLRLIESTQTSVPTRRHTLWKALTASVRVPLPVAVALVLLVLVSGTFSFINRPGKVATSTTSVVHIPVEVPVIQERVVTRVVYRSAKVQHTPRRSQSQLDNSTVARSQSVPTPGLTGFKPLDEVKLTVIKGGTPNEE